MLTPYPTSLAPEVLDAVLTLIRGELNTPHVVHCGWDVVGYALGKFYGEEFPVVGSEPPSEPMNKDELCFAIETLKAPPEPAAVRVGFNWRALVRALLPYLLQAL